MKQSNLVFLKYFMLFFTLLTTNVITAQEKNIETIFVEGIPFNMVKVKGGTYTTYHSPADSVGETITVGDFYIGETEITQQIWEAVMGENPSKHLNPHHPVECLRYIDCELFLMKLNHLTRHNFRMPTEAEWEYAARGGERDSITLFSGSNDIDSVAWYCNNSGNTSHDVKSKAPNGLGIYDMSGNVSEWCSQPKVSNTRSSLVGDRLMVHRGGGFLDFSNHILITDRQECHETVWSADVGLRIAE